MTANTKRLVRMLVRLFNRVDAAEQRSFEAEEWDSHFDGGEFSRPAHARLRQQNADRTARALGFADFELATRIAESVGVASASWCYHRAYAVADNRAAFFGYEEDPSGGYRLVAAR